MKLQSTARFAEDYEGLPPQIQLRVDKALGLLLDNPRHPSLQTKKIKGHENRYVLLRVGTHDLLK